MNFEERSKRARTQTVSNVSIQKKNATILSLLILFVLFTLDATYIYILAQGAGGLYFLGFWSALLVTFTAYTTYRAARNNSFNTAILVLNISIAIAATATSFAIKETGFALGITSALVIIQVTALTLPSQKMRQGILIGVTSLIGAILINYIDDPARIDLPALGNFITVLAVVVVTAQIILLLRDFQNYSLQSKLIIAFLGVAILSLGILTAVVNNFNQNILIQNAGASLTAETDSRALVVGNFIARELQGLNALSNDPRILTRVILANSTYREKTNAEIFDEIEKLDVSWLAAGDSDLLIRKVINDRTSTNLNSYKNAFPYNVEVFITDRYGALVSSTNRTSDYFQADEDWWRTANNFGIGSTYIGQPSYDESSDTYAIIMAVPIINPTTNRAEGVLRTTLDIKEIDVILTSSKLTTSAEINLYVEDGIKIPASGGQPTPGEEIALEIPILTPGYKLGEYEGTPSIVSRAPITTLDDERTGSILKQLGWSLVSHQPIAATTQQAQQQNGFILIISIVLLAAVALGGYLISQYIARPLQTLNAITEQMSAGDFTKRAAISTHDEIGELAQSFNKMADNLQKNLTYLEQSVIERTSDLDSARIQSERRATELQAVSEISKVITAEKNLKVLLPLVTELVSKRFGFYHSGIFLVDKTGKYAILEAASSEGGKIMLSRGHRLEVGTSGIVGYVAKSGTPRVALDVGEDAVYFNNPNLPETRSEMALPLVINDKISGVLDIQSRVPNAFSEQELNTMNILAGQISTAIENARLFEETQQALREAESLYQQNIRENWAAFSSEEKTIGYQQKLTDGSILTIPADSDQIRAAINQGVSLVSNSEETNNKPTIVVPIKIRGQVIGVINIEAPESGRNWITDEVNLAEVISERLSLALENARLIQESQSNVTKEQTISEVTSKISSSINLKNILQTAVEELGNAIPGSEVMIKLQSGEANPNHSDGDNHAE